MKSNIVWNQINIYYHKLHQIDREKTFNIPLNIECEW